MPFSVNLEALESRLKSTWRTFVWSARIAPIPGAEATSNQGRNSRVSGVILVRLEDHAWHRWDVFPGLVLRQTLVSPKPKCAVWLFRDGQNPVAGQAVAFIDGGPGRAVVAGYTAARPKPMHALRIAIDRLNTVLFQMAFGLGLSQAR